MLLRSKKKREGKSFIINISLFYVEWSATLPILILAQCNCKGKAQTKLNKK